MAENISEQQSEDAAHLPEDRVGLDDRCDQRDHWNPKIKNETNNTEFRFTERN